MATARLVLQTGPPDGVPGWLDWLYHLGRWIVDDVGGVLRETFTGEWLLKSFTFIILVVAAYFLGRTLAGFLRRRVLRPPRVDDAIARLMGHFVTFGIALLGFSAGLALFDTSLAAIATGLGLLTLALGFGMQNTVANLMGGISLAIDKPFRPGDRIEVGEYWGTVQQIGLRSTRILTPKKETVIVPNKIMEEREIWNYTLLSPEYRLDIDVIIAYDSDWRQAEKILHEIASQHPNMLHYRPVAVLMRQFADKGVELQLRAWMADVTFRAETISDILKLVKDRFDQAGIEIPVPSRILVHKKPRPAEGRRPEITSFQRAAPYGRRRIMVVVADPHDADEEATFATSLAKALSAGIVAAYVPASRQDARDAELSLRMMRELSRQQRIWFKPIMRTGPLAATIRELAEEESVDLVLVGHVRSRLASWKRPRDVADETRGAVSCPVAAIPPGHKVTPAFVATLESQIQEFRGEKRPVAATAAHDGNGSQASEDGPPTPHEAPGHEAPAEDADT